MSTLEIKDLYASVETKEGRKQILKGATLTVRSGETHAIMGPMGRASPPWPTPWPGIPSMRWIPVRPSWTGRTS